MKKTFLFLLSLIIIPNIVMGKTVSCNDTEVILDKDVLNVGDNANIKINTVDEYEASFTSSNTGVATVSEEGIIKGISVGTSNVSVKLTIKKGEDESSNCNVSLPIEVVSNNSKLKELDIEEYSLKEVFKSDKYDYEITLPYNIDKINIVAVAEDSDAKINGNGRKYLEENNNVFQVVVTASDNTTSTYKIIVNREKANDDASLKKLIVEGYVITPKFNKDVHKYSLSVDKDVEEVTINAVPNYQYATITGIGEKKLATGENIFTIVVTSESKKEEKYEIEINKLNGNSKLKSLEIKNGNLNEKFSDDKYSYTMKVYEDIETLDINASGYENDKVEIIGNERLRYGENTIIIKVTNDDKSSTTYKIIVSKLNSEERKEEEKNNRLVKILLIIFIISIMFMVYFIGLFIKRNYKKFKKNK